MCWLTVVTSITMFTIHKLLRLLEILFKVGMVILAEINLKVDFKVKKHVNSEKKSEKKMNSSTEYYEKKPAGLLM